MQSATSTVAEEPRSLLCTLQFWKIHGAPVLYATSGGVMGPSKCRRLYCPIHRGRVFADITIAIEQAGSAGEPRAGTSKSRNVWAL